MHTDPTLEATVEQNYRWNLIVNVLDGTTFWFALSFLSSTTIAPLYMSKLTDSPLALGLLGVIAYGAWFLPQLLTAGWIEGREQVKPVVIRAGFFLERLPVWLLVVSALVAARSPVLALVLFFVAYTWRGLGGGAVGPAWQDLIARCFPVDRRGRFMGTANALGTAAATAGAALSTWILASFAFPSQFVVLFAIAAVCITLSWFFLSLTREPAYPAGGRGSTRRTLAGLPGIVRADANFRRFLGARALVALGGIGTGFVTVSAVQRWGVPDRTVGLYTAALWLGQAAGNVVLGLLADRRGHKLSLELGTLAAAAAFGVAWLAPAPEAIYLVFVLIGIYSGALISSGVLVSLEFSAPERRPTYVGITNSTAGVANIAAPLLGAWLAAHSYDWTFAASCLAALAGWAAMHWWVREPRWAGMPVP
ncbi:MAG: MFS transporter [Anaerolineae bacterium]|nr:MFS transporter [Anaerolineae bacterium]